MTRKNKSARRATAAAAAAAAAAAPEESQVQGSPARPPATTLRTRSLVPEAAPTPPPCPDSPTGNNSSCSDDSSDSSWDLFDLDLNSLPPQAAALADVPAFLSTLIQTIHQHPDVKPSEGVVIDMLQAITRSAWAYSEPAADELKRPAVCDVLLHLLGEFFLRRHLHKDEDEMVDRLVPRVLMSGLHVEVEVKDLSEAGEDFKAYPNLCELAYATFLQFGPNHPFTVRAVYRVTESVFQRGKTPCLLLTWLVPRAVEHWGIDHPDTLRLVQHAAIHLYMCGDPRDFTELSQVVTEAALQLPGGLGWGKAVVAPVPDEAYCRHVFMARKAIKIKDQGHYKLAQDMLKRCVAYFDTLGCHWLGTPRKLQCMVALSDLAVRHDTLAESDAILLDAKRTAQRELGPSHQATLEILWKYGVKLLMLQKKPQALSIMQKTLRLLEETMGPRHYQTLECMVYLSGVLRDVGRASEGEAMLKHALEEGIKVEGGNGLVVRRAMSSLWMLLSRDPARTKEFAALKRRAATLGCDVDIFKGVRELTKAGTVLRVMTQLSERGVIGGAHKRSMKRMEAMIARAELEALLTNP